MKRTLLVLGVTVAAAMPAKADMTHKIMSSISLQVGGAVPCADRIGSSFSISSSGIDTTDGTTANTISAGTITSGIYARHDCSYTENPGKLSFSQSYTQGDAVPTSAVTTGATPNFSSIVSTAHGVAGDLAGTVASDGAMTITAGEAIAQYGRLTTEITIK